uniref:Thiol oxidase n=1 Tax=Emiliania huxleyi TaxID=2903 RepID=A0A7S3W1Z1_EMIHU
MLDHSSVDYSAVDSRRRESAPGWVVALVALASGVAIGLIAAPTAGPQPRDIWSELPAEVPHGWTNVQCPAGEIFRNAMWSAGCPPADPADAHEAAAFRLITAMAYRTYQSWRTWCGEAELRPPAGRPYGFPSFVAHTVSLLNLFDGLQLTRCRGLVDPLRDVLLAQLATSRTAPPLEWWEESFLPAAAAAFSCGFRGLAPPQEGQLLPADIRDVFGQSELVQRVWRLVQGYLQSTQKQREQPSLKSQDFDVSLYVPFLRPALPPPYAASHPYMNRSLLRVGVPHYQGPPTWLLWHTIAARAAELQRSCDPPLASAAVAELTKAPCSHVNRASSQPAPLGQAEFKRMLAFYALSHPCPQCREHFISRVSRNDRDWRALRKGPLQATESEAALYPLEWLFAGGANRSAATLEAKLAAVAGDPLWAASDIRAMSVTRLHRWSTATRSVCLCGSYTTRSTRR